MSDKEQLQRELEERILSKRQQIDFERRNLDFEAANSWENKESPGVMEESKNFSDPVETSLDSDELRALKNAEQELKELLKQLEDLKEG